MKKVYLFLCITVLIFFTACTNTNTKNDNSKKTDKKPAFINYNEGYNFGNKNAKITIVEYSSYECKDCRNLHKNIHSVLKKYIQNKTVLYIYKPVDHPKFINDEKINRYFAPQNLEDIENVFSKFDSYSNKTYDTVKNVLNLKEKDVPNYEEMDKSIRAEITSGNITGTPTLYINDKKYEEVFTEKDFQKILDSYKN